MANKKLQTYLKFILEIVNVENFEYEAGDYGCYYKVKYKQDKCINLARFYMNFTSEDFSLDIYVNDVRRHSIELGKRRKLLINPNFCLLYFKFKQLKKKQLNREKLDEIKSKNVDYDDLMKFIPNNKIRLMKVKKLLKK